MEVTELHTFHYITFLPCHCMPEIATTLVLQVFLWGLPLPQFRVRGSHWGGHTSASDRAGKKCLSKDRWTKYNRTWYL